MKDDLREKIMEAIWENGAAGQSEARAGADAALSAIHDAGYVILPRVPSEVMLAAAAKLWWLDWQGDEEVRLTVTDEQARQIYTAMIAAAEGEA